MTIKEMLPLDEYLAIFERYGKTDTEYLKYHYLRFYLTQKLFCENWSVSANGKRVLDVGAHWLHQSLLYARDGFEVTAADFPGTLSVPSVIDLADAHGISLFSYHNLSEINTFDAFPENSFDVIIFSEILEHITFNPVDMWKELYRVLSPGGRVIVTTPNYYYCRGRFWDFSRLIMRGGGGIPVHDILSINTYGHHWKEYSAREVRAYFEMLSPDFRVSRLCYATFEEPCYPHTIKDRVINWLESRVNILKKNIYAEISLEKKDCGIVVSPHW
ncbi:MAG: methyltransferase domain-containing protein [Rhodoferax sp.]|nr:methyltransferase domain-containing protein [Rhodoferax sp.]